MSAFSSNNLLNRPQSWDPSCYDGLFPPLRSAILFWTLAPDRSLKKLLLLLRLLDDNDSGTVGIAEVLGHMDDIRRELGSGGVDLKYPKNITELTKVSQLCVEHFVLLFAKVVASGQ